MTRFACRQKAAKAMRVCGHSLAVPTRLSQASISFSPHDQGRRFFLGAKRSVSQGCPKVPIGRCRKMSGCMRPLLANALLRIVWKGMQDQSPNLNSHGGYSDAMRPEPVGVKHGRREAFPFSTSFVGVFSAHSALGGKATEPSGTWPCVWRERRSVRESLSATDHQRPRGEVARERRGGDIDLA